MDKCQSWLLKSLLQGPPRHCGVLYFQDPASRVILRANRKPQVPASISSLPSLMIRQWPLLNIISMTTEET